jgi:hypothetical protein
MERNRFVARYIIFISIVFALTGCAAQNSAPVAPENVYMARHITNVHGVKIGPYEDADIMVERREGKIRVVFNAKFYKTLPPQIFYILRIDGKETEMTKEEYISFLGSLHAYLMITPSSPTQSDRRNMK